MKSFYLLYFLFYFLTGNFITPLIFIFIIYIIIDKMYFGLLSDLIFGPLKRKKRIKTLLTELELNKTNANSALEAGILYFESKKYKNAIEYLQKAKERIDDSARLFVYSGMAHMELKEYEKGREEIHKALEIDSSVIFGLPYIYLIRYELSKQSVNTEEVVKLEESLDRFANTENFYRMGRVYQKSRNQEKAVEMFTFALKDYSYIQKKFRRIHRKWALLARFHKSLWLSVSILLILLILFIVSFGFFVRYSMF